MSDEITTLELGTFSVMSYKIHPSVPLQMMDFYYRKSETNMIGALLGYIESTYIFITNCYAIPLNREEDPDDEDGEGALFIDKDFHRKMFDLNKKVNPNEVLVGWFTDLSSIDLDTVAFLQYFGSKEANFVGKPHVFTSPLTVLVDPFAENTIFGLKGYITPPMHICKDTFGVFQQVELAYEFSNEAVNEIAPLLLDKTELKGEQSKNPYGLINLDTFEDQLKETLTNLKKLQNYVSDVNAGKEKKNSAIGQAIKKILNLTPSLEHAQFKDLVQKYMQDILMVMYLSNLANSQVLISEKLGKIA